MFNQAIVIGKLARKPSIFDIGEHTKACFTIECTKQYGDKTRKQYVNCEAWNLWADKVKTCDEGMVLLVMGKNDQSSYEKNGEKVYKSFVAVESVHAIINL